MRAFVAVPVPGHVREALDRALASLRPGPDVVRWAHPATWHVTLRFLGEIEDELVGPLEQALRTAVGDHGSFELRLGDAGHFRRSTLWYGLEDEPSDALTALAEDVRRATAEVVPDPEPRTFRAHLTVARTRGQQRVPAGFPETLPAVTAAWTVDQVVLYRSELGPDRAHHELLVTVPLTV